MIQRLGALLPLITKLHFARFEFKYILSARLRNEIESELAYFLTLDPYVASKPHKKYFVRSLYFDDPLYSDYYEKTDGVKKRKKFRIRTYTSDPNEGCATFLEIKGKYNAFVFKHRSPLQKLTTDDLLSCNGNMAQITISKTENSPVLDQFRFNLERKRLKPVMLIDYLRRPYLSKYDSEFRLTFDDTLQGTSTDTLFPRPWDTSFSIVRGFTVMEIKFRYNIPSWFHRVIQSYELRRVSISKYCKGIEACKIAPNLE